MSDQYSDAKMDSAAVFAFLKPWAAPTAEMFSIEITENGSESLTNFNDGVGSGFPFCSS